MFYIFGLLMLLYSHASAIEKLHEKYLVSYGDPTAPIHIIEYFSFQCPHCLSLFKKDFRRIEETFIRPNRVYWTFHPIPTDLNTVQGMICLASLESSKKKLFLETLLEEGEANNPDYTSLIMLKVMELIEKPIPKLNNEDFIEQTDAFLDAFTFLTQKDKIQAVPTFTVNSKLFPKEVPDFEFVNTVVKQGESS